jgi:hypothetical protein
MGGAMILELIIIVGICWFAYKRINKNDALPAPEQALAAALQQAHHDHQNTERTDANLAPMSVIHTLIGTMHRYGITPEDITAEWDNVPKTQTEALHYSPAPAKKSLSEVAMQVFGYLGAAFIIAGLGVFISQFWDSIGSFGRIFVTLGTGIGLNVLFVRFMHLQTYPKAHFPLYIASVIMQMSGWFVVLYEFFPHGDNPQKAILAVALVMTITQCTLFYLFKRSTILACALLMFYTALQALLDIIGVDVEYASLLLGASVLSVGAWLKRSPYAVLAPLFYVIAAIWFNAGLFMVLSDLMREDIAATITGISLISLGFGLKQVEEDTLTGYAYFVGSSLLLSGVFDLVNNTSFELLYFGLVICLIYLSTALQSRAILFTSICALLGYIGYYTSNYFVDSLGWPLALVLMGCLFFGVAMMAVKVRKKIG